MRKFLAVILTFCCLALVACDQVSTGRSALKKVEVWLDASPELLALLHEEIGDTFADKPGIRVNFRVVKFGDLKPTIFGSRSGSLSERPDLVMFSSDWLGELVAQKLIVQLSEPEPQYLPIASAAMHWQGKCYGIPWSLDTVALIVNNKLVSAAPEDLSQMLELKNTLPAGVFPLIYDNKNFYYHAAWFHAFSDGLFPQGKLRVADENAIRSFDFAHELENIHAIVPAKANQAAATNLFCAGQAAMTINGPWAVPEFIRNRVDFSVVPIPSPSEDTLARPFVGVKGLAITSFARDHELAMKVARRITSVSFMEKVAAKSMFVPCYKSSGEKSQSWIKGFVNQAQQGVLMPANPEMKFVWSELNRALRLRFSTTDSSRLILEQAQERIDDAINQEMDKQ